MRRDGERADAIQATVIVVLAAFVSGCSYNKFTTQEEAIKARWGEVQNQLQRRNDLIPNLVETVKGYAAHEEGVYKDIADSRSKLLAAKSPEETIQAANQQTAALGRLLAVVENYPQPQGERAVQSIDGRARRHRKPDRRRAQALQRRPSRSTTPSGVASRQRHREDVRLQGVSRITKRRRPRRRRRRWTSRSRARATGDRLSRHWNGPRGDGGSAAVGGHGIRAQGPQPAPPLSPPINASTDPLLKNFIWRAIGPANMGGRIDDIAVVESNPSTIYVGFATGGVWKTVNNGTTFTPIFDEQPVTSIGDIAIAPSNPNVVYVGTGEPNNRQSSSFGAGMYKSIDARQDVGARRPRRNAEHRAHRRPSEGSEHRLRRGRRTSVRAEPGARALQDHRRRQDLDEHEVHRQRHGLHRRRDGSGRTRTSSTRRRTSGAARRGASTAAAPAAASGRRPTPARRWTKLTGNGLPTNPIIGRIGLDIARSKPQTIYASIEVGPSGGTGAGVNDDGTLSAGAGQRRLSAAGAAAARRRRRPIRTSPASGDRTTAGKTWKFLSNSMDRPMYYSQIRVDPTNAEIAYQGGAPFFKTIDGGKTWRQVQGLAHSDHHAIWIDPKNSNHLIVGNDGGLDVTYDQTETWEFVNTVAVGQFYKVSADMRKPYYVCGGLQDNGSWCGPSATRSRERHPELRLVPRRRRRRLLHRERSERLVHPLFRIAGRRDEPARSGSGTDDQHPPARTVARPAGDRRRGEGADPDDARAVRRSARDRRPATSSRRRRPTPTIRFYWNTPFMLSPHNPSTVYLGGDRLFQVDRPRHDVDGVAGPDEEHRPQRSARSWAWTARRRWRRSTTAPPPSATS